MAFSFTGLSYLIGSVVLALLAMRFFRYWKQERSFAARMLFFFVLFLFFFFIFTAILTLFFAYSTPALRLAVIEAVILQGIALSFLGYLLLRLKVPSISPFLGPVCILSVSGVCAVLAILLPYVPRFVPEELIIQWNAPMIVSVPRTVIFFLTFLPLAWVFFQEYRTTQEAKAKERAFGFAVAMSIGFLMGSFDFVFEQVFGLSEVVSDIVSNVAFGILLFAILVPSWFQRKEVV